MPDIKDPTWGDTGFDEADDGFFQAPPAPEAPAPRRVVIPPPPPPPPPTRDRGDGRGFRMAVGALLLLIIALGGVLIWHLFFRVTPGVHDETPVVARRAVEPMPTEAPIVDTGVVVQAESTPPASSATPPPTTTPIIGPEPTQLATKDAPVTNEPMYVVQVFSSPSRDDAEEWAEQLRNKNVSEVYIAEQPIKGQMWYRVRFGRFTRREEAEFAALKVGVAQPWIARIR
jgi:cell division septation protein DedD